jgi:hypothetical protein
MRRARARPSDWVDADHYRHLQVLPVAQNFDH